MTYKVNISYTDEKFLSIEDSDKDIKMFKLKIVNAIYFYEKNPKL